MKRIKNKAGNLLAETKNLRKKNRIRWYLIANRNSASIYENTHSNVFNFVKKLSFSFGRLRDRDFNSDKAGIQMLRVGNAKIRHASQRGFKHSKTLGKLFAKKIANFLVINENRKQFNELIVVSEPGFLGILRSALPDKIKKLVKKEINRDYMSSSKSLEHDHILNAIQAYKDHPRPVSPTYFYLTDRSPYPY